MLVPTEPKIYHIVHVDRLASIVADGYLWSDTEARNRGVTGTMIGIPDIKEGRLSNQISSHPGLHVGDCVPFYFSPRSVMLYVIHRANNPELVYLDGQGSIIHLEADLRNTVDWANANNRRWSFTSSNAGSGYFEDYCDLAQLDKLHWDAIEARDWRGERKEFKQAEFLVENSFPWKLVSRIGVSSQKTNTSVQNTLHGALHHPPVEIKPDWYY